MSNVGQHAPRKTDASGSISEAELEAAIANFYRTDLKTDIVKQMMLVADTGKDGEISLQEFKAVMRTAAVTSPSRRPSRAQQFTQTVRLRLNSLSPAAVTLLGAFVNVVLAAFKLWVGALVGSASLLVRQPLSICRAPGWLGLPAVFPAALLGRALRSPVARSIETRHRRQTAGTARAISSLTLSAGSP